MHPRSKNGKAPGNEKPIEVVKAQPLLEARGHAWAVRLGPGAGLFPGQPDAIHYFVTPIDMTELTALLAKLN